MGRYPIGDRAMTNAEKQKNYRQRVEEKRKRQAINSMEVCTELLNAKAKIRQLEYLTTLTEDDEYEKLKKENERLKKENIQLKTEINRTDPVEENQGRLKDAIERAMERSTSGAWSKK